MGAAKPQLVAEPLRLSFGSVHRHGSVDDRRVPAPKPQPPVLPQPHPAARHRAHPAGQPPPGDRHARLERHRRRLGALAAGGGGPRLAVAQRRTGLRRRAALPAGLGPPGAAGADQPLDGGAPAAPLPAGRGRAGGAAGRLRPLRALWPRGAPAAHRPGGHGRRPRRGPRSRGNRPAGPGLAAGLSGPGRRPRSRHPDAPRPRRPAGGTRGPSSPSR